MDRGFFLNMPQKKGDTMKEILLLVIDLAIGLLYYKMAVSKDKFFQRIAIVCKISLLVISFTLEFVRQDFIIIGQFAIGEHTTVLWLILFEIADTFVDRKKRK